MTEATLAPVTEDETQILWESEMTPGEKTRKMALEARASGCQRDKARCLLHIHQECLFRGESGKRSWGRYLEEEGELLGYSGMNTDKASLEMMWVLLCDAVEQWNNDHPGRDPLPMPKSRRWLDGWSTLFDRYSGPYGWARFADNAADRAVKALYDGVIAGNPASTHGGFTALGRAQRSSHGRPALKGSSPASRSSFGSGEPRSVPPATGGATSPATTIEVTPSSNGSTKPPEVIKRTVSAEDLEAAERARLERQYRAEQEALREKEDREHGIDPRSIQTLEKNDLNIVAEAEVFATLTNKVSIACQELEVWVRGKLNAYGSEFFDSMQQFALGINSAHGRIDQIEAAQERLERVATNLRDDLEPGCFTGADSFEPEPPLQRGA